MIKIGITTRKLNSINNRELTSIPNDYLNILKEFAYVVIIDSEIDLTKYKQELLNQIKELDGFILIGGSEISNVDLLIIDYCYNNNLPLLGICLGMQEIASYFNKNNLIKLKDNFHMNEKDKYVHEIEISDNSYLFKLLNKKIIKVNSKHNYCVTNDNHYTIEATYNNVIEAIKVKDRNYILGLQFHPELLYNDDKNAKLIFKDFFNKCTNNYLRI